MAKSFLMQPLALFHSTQERPDRGSYQLEKRLGKALVFLYDFGYDRDTKKWCNWGYLKRFLESDPLPVACPRNREGNRELKHQTLLPVPARCSAF